MMRGLTVSFAILCLALANGAPAAEENNLPTKNYKFGQKDVIYSVNNIFKDEWVYATCEGNDVDKKCKVYLEKTDPNESNVQSCDMNLSYTKPYWVQLTLQNTGYKKVIFVVRDGQKAKLIIVDMSNCQVKEGTVDLMETMRNPKDTQPPKVITIPHEDNFDALFNNRNLCQSPLCKATWDYDGKLVKKATGFGMKNLVDDNFYLELDKDRLFKLYNESQSKVYVIRNGVLDESPLFFADQPDTTATSTDENKIGFCNYTGNKIACQQYDGEGKSKIFEGETALDADWHVVPRHFNMLNLEKGMLTVMAALEKKGDKITSRQILAVHFDEQGKPGKVINVGPNIGMEDDGDFYLNLYKNKMGEPCLLSLYFYYHSKTDNSSTDNTAFTRITKCFTKDELA